MTWHPEQKPETVKKKKKKKKKERKKEKANQGKTEEILKKNVSVNHNV